MALRRAAAAGLMRRSLFHGVSIKAALFVSEAAPCASLASLLTRRATSSSASSSAPSFASAAAPSVAVPAPLYELSPLPARSAPAGTRSAIVLPVHDLAGNVVGEKTLAGPVFDAPVRTDLLHRCVVWQQSRLRAGTAVVKGRSDVRGGGRKPRPQKGSGRSRQGTIRAPQWRGGGKAHGPVARSFALDLPKRMRRRALEAAVSAKAAEGRLVLVDTFSSLGPRGKTGAVAAAVDALLAGHPRRSALLSDADPVGAPKDGGRPLRAGAANLPWVDVLESKGLNVLSILRRDVLVMTQASADALVARLSTPIRPGAKGC